MAGAERFALTTIREAAARLLEFANKGTMDKAKIKAEIAQAKQSLENAEDLLG